MTLKRAVLTCSRLQVYSQDKWSTGAKSYVAATMTGFWRWGAE